MLFSDVIEIDYQVWLFYGVFGQMVIEIILLQVIVDLVSGDNDSSDGKNINFDVFYGVCCFDFGFIEVYCIML